MGLDLLLVVAAAPPSASHLFLTTIKPLVPTIPSYIKDSPHLISLLENTPIPSNAILATIDVSSLYTNIPQDEGTEACLDAIDATEASHIPRDVLRQRVFSFDGKMYEQIQGTAMGTKIAPSYANLFMDKFERAFLAQEPIQPLVWKRYIDDILCIWVGTRSELESFLDRLNKAHRTLKFTWSISDERVEFLDLNLFKGGRFNTTNYLRYAFALIGTFPKQRDWYPCTATLLGNRMTFLETIGSFP